MSLKRLFALEPALWIVLKKSSLHPRALQDNHRPHQSYPDMPSSLQSPPIVVLPNTPAAPAHSYLDLVLPLVHLCLQPPLLLALLPQPALQLALLPPHQLNVPLQLLHSLLALG